MEKIRIKNFGPIVDATIEVRDYNIFIGPTSSGKSIIAKLISIFKSENSVLYADYNEFLDACTGYNIHSFINQQTEVKFSKEKFSWTFKSKGEKMVQSNNYAEDIGYIRSAINLYPDKLLTILGQPGLLKGPKANKQPSNLDNLYSDLFEILHSFPLKGHSEDFRENANQRILSFYEIASQELGICRINYIPAERIILSMVAESIFGLLSNDVSISESIKEFGSLFERSRKEIPSLYIDFLGAKYEYLEKENRLMVGVGESVLIKLEESSSGFQSLIPMLVILEYILQNSKKNQVIIGHVSQNKAKAYQDPFQYRNLIVIEEPELSLYPTMQKDLIERAISICKASNSKLIITTHSPYVITTIDNLIAAQNVIDDKPGSEKEVDKLVSKDKRISHENVSCYYIDNGKATDIFDRKSKTIKSFMIDDVSESIGNTFDKLLDLRYS